MQYVDVIENFRQRADALVNPVGKEVHQLLSEKHDMRPQCVAVVMRAHDFSANVPPRTICRLAAHDVIIHEDGFTNASSVTYASSPSTTMDTWRVVRRTGHTAPTVCR